MVVSKSQIIYLPLKVNMTHYTAKYYDIITEYIPCPIHFLIYSETIFCLLVTVLK